jgi:hypothetical protein
MATQATTQVRELRSAGPVRITLPARVAYDPDALKKSIASIAEQLGCPKCFSGADCYFQTEREFVVNPPGKATPAGPVAGILPEAVQGPDPTPWKVTVGLSSGVKYDLDKIFTAVDRVIDLIGPHPCISGFDVLFRDELNVIVVNEQLKGQRFGQRF